jgi:hypothetical protein
MARVRISSGIAVALLFALAGVCGAATDVSTDTVTCDTLIGTVKIKPALTLMTGIPLTITVKGVVAGCTDGVNGSVKILASKFSAKLSSISTGCGGLLGSSPISGPIKVSWKADKTTPITPKASVIMTTTLTGGIYGYAPWFTPYGMLTLAASGVTGAFTGSDGGASTAAVAALADSIGVLGTDCGLAGIGQMHLGLGTLKVQ